MSEAYLEKKTAKYATEKGFLTYKFSSPGRRAVPDRIFIKRGYLFFIEFKEKGQEPSKHQWFIIQRLKVNGMNVYVVDDYEEAKRIIDFHA
jgi:hypothetical protein